MNQLILNVMKGGLLAIALKAPAAAQTFEVTFAGTFTSREDSVSCVEVAGDCTPSSFLETISIPYTQTMRISFGLQSGYSPGTTTVIADDNQVLYRRSQLLGGASELLDGSGVQDILPAAIIQSTPRPASVANYNRDWLAYTSRSVIQYSDGRPPQHARQSWSLLNGQSWSNGSSELEPIWGSTLSLSLTSPFPVTPENFDDTMTRENFLSMVQSSVGCVGCVAIHSQSFYFGPNTTVNTFASGTATLLSLAILPSAVPEIQTGVLMLFGLGILGWMVGRSKRMQAGSQR